MFQLQIADADVTNGTIAVSWCLDEEILKELADKQVQDPHVVICVAPQDNYHLAKEYRKVVPLKDLMTYIEFRVPGKNKIWGFVSYQKGKDARKKYLGKQDGEFQTNILSYDGDEYASWLSDDEELPDGTFQSLSTPFTVAVPKAVFAKEPRKWEKTWVNYLFRDKVIDQCEFRRRRLFAYGLQPFIMLGNLLLRSVIILFATLTLCKNISLKYLFHPLMYSLKDTFEVFEKGSVAVVHLPEDDREVDKFPPPAYFIKSFWKTPIMPLIWLPVLWMVWHHKYVGLSILGATLFLVFVLLMLIGFLTNHFKVVKNFFAKIGSWFESDELWYMEEGEIDMVLCTKDKKPLTYNNLPGHRKTIRLRFQNLKSKVCKPFSL
jgi:hypothetical protein